MIKLKCIIIRFLLSILLLANLLIPVKANGLSDEKVYASNSDIEQALNHTVLHSEKYVDQEDIEAGLSQAKKLNTELKSNGGYQWYLVSQTVHKKYGALKGKYKKKVSAGISKSTSGGIDSLFLE